jgi:hypothetical protein
MLAQVARQFPALAGEYEWIRAFIGRRSISSIKAFLDLIADPRWTGSRDTMNAWSIGRDIAALAMHLVGLKEELLGRFRTSTGGARQVIEHALAKIGGPDVVIALAHDHAASGRPFDSVLDEAIRGTALAEEPASGWVGAFEIHPVAVPELRSELFAMLNETPAEAAIAGACLDAIDQLRDEYGPAGLEPRHPDITSNRRWPLVA